MTLVIFCLFTYPQAFSPSEMTSYQFWAESRQIVWSSSSILQAFSLSQPVEQDILYMFFLLIAPISSNKFTMRYTVAAPIEESMEEAL